MEYEYCCGKKITSGIGTLKQIKNYVDRGTLIPSYSAQISPHFDCSCEIWDTPVSGLYQRL